MLAIPSAWEFASLVCKLFLYIGAASIAGGSLCLWLYADGSRQNLHRNLNYIVAGSLLGFQAVVLNFLIQVGMVNLDGIKGMFDWGMASLLMSTSLGEMSMARLLGFVLVLIASLRMSLVSSALTRPPTLGFYRLLAAIHGLGLFCIAYSFSIAGHISVLSVFSQVAIVLHVVAVSAWLGSLYPLYQLTRSMKLEDLQLTMRRFGDGAVLVVAVLLVAGVIMLWGLLTSPMQLLQTVYGNALLLKLALVVALLLVAALNKLYLVPKLSAAGTVAKLRASIRTEAGVATAILLVTSYLSTLIGPPDH